MEQLTLSEYQQRKEIIRQQLSQTVESFLIIGHQLREIEETQSYKLEGYASLSDMAKAEFNLRRDTVSRFMDISAKLTVDGNGVELLPELKGLTYSKLQDVLTLPVTDYELLTPQSKVSEIRELKAFNKADATKEILEARNVPAEETVLSPLRRCIRDLFKEPGNRSTLNMIMNTVNLPEYEEPESYDRQICEEMNPAGSRTHKKGLIYLFMYSYETGIKYKKMGKPLPDKMTWHEFIQEIAGTFAGYRDETGETWNNVFGKDKEENKQPELPGQMNLEDIRQEQEATVPKTEEGENQEIRNQETSQEQHQEKDKAKIATSQQKRKAPDPKEGMTREEPATSQAAEEDQLPGQMDVSDYPGVVVEAEYRELPAETEHTGTGTECAESGTGYPENETECVEVETEHTESRLEASRQQDTTGKVLFQPEALPQEQNIRFVPTRETCADQSEPFTAMNPPTPATEEERTALLQSAWNEARLASGTVNTLMQSTFLATLTRETADLILQNAGRLITNLSYICGELYQWEPTPSAPDLEAD